MHARKPGGSGPLADGNVFDGWPVWWQGAGMDVIAPAEAWRRDGFVILPGYLPGGGMRRGAG
jgi:hypothetical protein